MRKIIQLGFIFVVILVFFWQFFLKGLLPIPGDTIVGLYYPFRDIYAKTNPNGVPFKNFLITDPVRQQYPWKNLVINIEKKGELPLWNPYNFAGTPLLANFQSAAFYPFNILFFFLPFQISWSLLILFEPLLAGIFLYLYLNNLKLRKEASLLGAIVFSFSGFSIAWMQWGTIVHTALWLPLVLFSVDKLFIQFNNSRLLNKYILVWSIIFVLSLAFSFFAGHLQTFFYLLVFVLFYCFAKLLLIKRKIKSLAYLLCLFTILLFITFIQWFPTIRFIAFSARNIDLNSWKELGWFIPWQNIVQFIAPDFFGNPATLNYWGIWNYGEFIGYIGIFPLIMALLAMFFRKDKKTFFFGAAFFLSLILAFPTIFAKIPFQLQLPYISTSQPTRLIFITDFSLSVLAALGVDYFTRIKNKKPILYILSIFVLIFLCIWSFVLSFHGNLALSSNLNVSKQNLILPTILFIFISIVLLISVFASGSKFKDKILITSLYVLILVTIIDLFRFGWKFEPFTKKEYLFPETKVITFLQNQKQPFRIMSTDSRILPPNFSIMYKLQTLDGYDPLYLQRYGELMAASGRGNPDIKAPLGFNRIITPHNFESKIIDLLGVKYILSLSDLNSKKLEKVFQEGETRVYENKEVLPRVFFVDQIKLVRNKNEAIEEMFRSDFNLLNAAVAEKSRGVNRNPPLRWTKGRTEIVEYSTNRIVIKTGDKGDGFLVLTDSYYPTWHAKIDGKETEIYLTDFNFRGVIVPKGNHTIEFYDTLF